jgi:transcriptional regulator with XRE-family HTH domain
MEHNTTSILEQLPEEDFFPRNDYFAVSLTILRAVCRMSQGDLAVAAGVTNSAISDYERGKVDPQSQTLHKLLRGLKLPLSILEETYAFIELVRGQVGASGSGIAPRSEPDDRTREIAVVSAEVGRTAARVTRLLLELLRGE